MPPLSIFLLLILLLNSPVLMAQKGTAFDIIGQVIDETGSGMPGVNVVIKNTTKGTVADNEGKFKIQVPDKKAILVFSFVGYQTQEVPAVSNVVNVALAPIANALDEVVVIGYGEQKRKDLTGAVGKANIEEMEKAPVVSFDQALAGRVAGVVVTSGDGQPGTSSQIAIRGSSVSQDASPLFVIDGFPIENMDVNSINPKDIESLEVLKDASSIAIYGARGANGVILITTKRGKAGPPRISYDVSYGIMQDANRVKMMSPYEFVKLQLDIDSLLSTPTAPNNRFRNLYLGQADANGARAKTLEDYRNTEGYDWQDLLLRQGSLMNHTLNISGGNKDTKYALRGSFLDQKGIIINSGTRRYDGRFTLDQRLKPDLKLGLTASFSSTQSFGNISTIGNGASVVQGMWQYRPVNGVGDQNLENQLADSLALADFYASGSSFLFDNIVSPLKQAQNEYRKNTNNTGMANAFVEYSFLKNFKLKIAGGVNITQLDYEQFYNSSTQQGNLFRNSGGASVNQNGINGSYNNVLNQSYLNENTLSYVRKVNKTSKIDAVAGFTYQYGKSRTYGFRSINIPQAQEYLGMQSLGTGTANFPSSAVVTATHHQLFSFLGRLNYTLLDRYLFTASMRSDGSSKFTPGKQWGYFPSAALAWRFMEEPFMKSLKNVLSDGKFRIGYGTVGNNRVGDFSYLSQYGALNTGHGYPFNNVYSGGVVPFFYGNDDLTWETVKELNVGANLAFFKDRILLDVDVYDRQSKNFLVGVILPAIAGYANGQNAQYQNTGRISNRGIELSLTTTNVKAKDFSWTSNFNISFNRSKILEFYKGFNVRGTQWNLTGNAVAWVAKAGGPISQFYGYVYDGTYKYEDFEKLANGRYQLEAGIAAYTPTNANQPIQPGDPRYRDLNGDGIVDLNDKTTLGSPLLFHTGGLSNNFSYKGLSLNVFFQWSYGNEVMNANRIIFEQGAYTPNINQFASYADRWSPSNPTSDIPRLFNGRGDAGSANPRVSSRLIEDASFLRLKTVSLSYSLPQKWMRKAKFYSVNIYASAQNLLTWTKYTGIDPEVSTYRSPNSASSPVGTASGTSGTVNFGGTGYTFIQPSSGYSVLAGGFDLTPYPRARTYTLGLNVSF